MRAAITGGDALAAAQTCPQVRHPSEHPAGRPFAVRRNSGGTERRRHGHGKDRSRTIAALDEPVAARRPATPYSKHGGRSRQASTQQRLAWPETMQEAQRPIAAGLQRAGDAAPSTPDIFSGTNARGDPAKGRRTLSAKNKYCPWWRRIVQISRKPALRTVQQASRVVLKAVEMPACRALGARRALACRARQGGPHMGLAAHGKVGAEGAARRGNGKRLASMRRQGVPGMQIRAAGPLSAREARALAPPIRSANPLMAGPV